MATVVDSRATDLGQAWKNMEGSRSPHEPVYRLVVAEDLPEETISLLEGVLNGDRRVLLDHAANKSFPNQGWDEHRLQNPKTEFYANLSELPETMSIALPYEIQARPIASGGVYTRLVERSVAKRSESSGWSDVRSDRIIGEASSCSEYIMAKGAAPRS